MTDAFEVAVIGCGGIGALRARVADSHPLVRQVRLYDAEAEKAKQWEASLPKAIAAGSLEEALDSEEVRAVIVSTGEEQHVEPVLAGLERGKPTLVEKPLASSLEDADLLTRAAAETATPLSVGYTQRFRRRFLNAKEHIAQGRIGRIHSLRGHRYTGGAVAKKIGSRSPSVSPAFDSLTYVVDLVLWYSTDKTPVSVVARSTYADEPPNRPVSTWAVLTFDDGATYSLGVSWQLTRWHPAAHVTALDIFGDEGFIAIDDSHREFLLTGDVEWASPYTPDVKLHTLNVGARPAGDDALGRFHGPLADETRAFLDSVAAQRDDPVLATAAHAREVVAITQAIDRSAEERTEIDL